MLNLRELYARDLQGRRGSGIMIDSAFGLTLASSHAQSEEFEQDEDIQLERREIDHTPDTV